jgi:tRNA-splicing ligase RtcB (3'-phosphate/5'-hydroxy nucleic acid ligase)
MITLQGKYGKSNIMIDTIEDECIAQIYGFLNHPIYTNPVAIMPDTHAGKGSVIGFTMEMTKGICPSVVGVDIGCGISCWQLAYREFNFEEIDKQIRAQIPLGPRNHNKPIATMYRDFNWWSAWMEAIKFIEQLNKDFDTDYEIRSNPINYDYYTGPAALCDRIKNSHQKTEDYISSVDKSIGTLGGGNHYIEIGIDENDQHYLTIHSGSRNFGLRIANYFQKVATEQEHNKGYNKDLAYLKNGWSINYFKAMIIAQNFASMNRDLMSKIIAKECDFKLGEKIESVHNYIDFRDMIIRKGAIRSYTREKMVIPFNMKDGMWICEGKSNPDWNYSAPHGAGRIMSRSQAKRTLSLDVFQKEMDDAGVWSSGICAATLDEAPGSYKSAQIIQDAIEPTATILHKVKPIYNLKSSEEIGYKKGRR